ncbi:uncharacterized protein LOC144928005 isoform X1 [Branchiostoma floridae x Branchiostoma belcheri]
MATSGVVCVLVCWCGLQVMAGPRVPYPTNVRGMVGLSAKLPASISQDNLIISLTWSKIDGSVGGTREAVLIYSPATNTNIALGSVKGRSTLNEDGSLVIDNLTLTDGGLYVMTVLINTIGQVEQYVQLKIHVPPSVSIDYAGYPIQVIEGTSTTINCTVLNSSALVQPAYWTKDGVKLDDSNLGSFRTVRLDDTGDTSSLSLLIPDVTRARDSGNYSCVAVHIGGVASDSVNMEVLYPAAVTNMSTAVTIEEGKNLDLFCQAEGYPPPNITWYRSAQTGPLLTTIGYYTLEMAVLTLPVLTLNDTRDYTCAAWNGIGTQDLKSVSVTVIKAKKIPVPPVTIPDPEEVEKTSSETWPLFRIAIFAGAAAGGVLVITVLLLGALVVCRKDRNHENHTQCRLVSIVPPITDAEMEMTTKEISPGTTMSRDSYSTTSLLSEKCVAKAIEPYDVNEPGLLKLKVGDMVEVLKTGSDGWWYGCTQGKMGAFPAGCVTMVKKPAATDTSNGHLSGGQTGGAQCSADDDMKSSRYVTVYSTIPVGTLKRKAQAEDETKLQETSATLPKPTTLPKPKTPVIPEPPKVPTSATMSGSATLPAKETPKPKTPTTPVPPPQTPIPTCSEKVAERSRVEYVETDLDDDETIKAMTLKMQKLNPSLLNPSHYETRL